MPLGMVALGLAIAGRRGLGRAIRPMARAQTANVQFVLTNRKPMSLPRRPGVLL